METEDGARSPGTLRGEPKDFRPSSLVRRENWKSSRTDLISTVLRKVFSRMGWRIRKPKVRRQVWWEGENSCKRIWRERGGQWSGNMRQRSHQRVRDMFGGLMHQGFSWVTGKVCKNGAGLEGMECQVHFWTPVW